MTAFISCRTLTTTTTTTALIRAIGSYTYIINRPKLYVHRWTRVNSKNVNVEHRPPHQRVFMVYESAVTPVAGPGSGADEDYDPAAVGVGATLVSSPGNTSSPLNVAMSRLKNTSNTPPLEESHVAHHQLLTHLSSSSTSAPPAHNSSAPCPHVPPNLGT